MRTGGAKIYGLTVIDPRNDNSVLGSPCLINGGIDCIPQRSSVFRSPVSTPPVPDYPLAMILPQ
jgi:hypothetical protein